MSKFFNDPFKLKARNGKIGTEIIAGIVAFAAMCYVLPVNMSILGSEYGMSMPQQGVFAATAIVCAIACIVMGILANVPMVLGAGMGMNAFVSFTVGGQMDFSWQECMILLTVSGIIFLVLSVTPLRQYLMSKFNKNLKLIISAGLGAFIAFVGFTNSGIIVNDPTGGVPVKMASLDTPGVIISIIALILVFGLLVSKVKFLSKFALPLIMLVSAIVATILSSVLASGINGTASEIADQWSGLGLVPTPWDPNSTAQWGFWGDGGLKDVLFFGLISGNNSKSFGEMLVNVFSNPMTYVAIFSLTFVNLFDTTATLISLGNKLGIIDHETGKIENGNKIILGDAIGSLVCAPIGTTTVTTFVQSSLAIDMGAKTGITAISTGVMFLLSAFIAPVFSVFTPGCVTGPALVAVGGIIFVESIKDINWKDFIVPLTAFIGVITMVLTYSLVDGIGLSLISYVVMMLFAGRHKELNAVLYVLSAVFAVSFVLNTVMANYEPPTTANVLAI